MVTVADVLALDVLGLRPLVLPHRDAEVRWVAASELTDPTPYLEGGEVVLTTGLDAVGWRQEWQGYVDRLVQAGVVALGFAAGLTHRKVPARLEQACERAGLTLFEVPRQTTFVAVSRAVARLLGEAEQAAAREAVRIQRDLTQAALQRDDPLLVRKLATGLRGAACVLAPDGHLEIPTVGPASGLLDLEALAVEVARMRPQGLRAASSLTGREGTTVVHPLGLRGRPGAWLAVATPGRFGEGQRSAVATAVALLSLAAESRNDRRETGRMLRRRALELLVSDEPRTASIVLGAATGGSPDRVRLPTRVQVVHATGDLTALEESWELVEGDASLSDAVAARVGDTLRAVVPPGRAPTLVTALSGAGLRVGVGSAVPVGEARRSDTTAAHALDQTTAASPVVWWDRLVNEGALALLDPDQATAFAESFLAPLEASGAAAGELVATLRSFLRHHGSRGDVAVELGVHRNTVRNRVQQIEAALGRSLDDPQVRVNAWIALQAGTTGVVAPVSRPGR